MAGPWEKYQQHAAGDQPQPIQDGPWAKYQAPARDEVAANDATADHGGIQASDFGKEVAGGALVGTGAVVSGVGDLLTTAGTALESGARTVLPNGAVDALKSIPGPSDLLFRPAGRQIESAGKGIQDTKSEAAKQALEASTPQGDILDPSSWSMGDDPSLAGYGLQASNLIGQFVPQAVALAIPGGQARMVGMAGVGGLQAGGAAGNEEEQRIAALPDAELQQASELYRELRGSGMDEATARAQVSATARAAAFQGAAPVGAVGGAMTNYALGPLQRLIGGGVGRRLAGGLFLDAPAEGAQEVSEAVAARAATNRAIGERRDLTEDTFADAVLGAMGGAGHATLGAALGRPQAAARPVDPAAEADATFENTPEPAALPAPGLQGLPAPEQTFYADSQGNMQDTGPVRNVDGEMQPDQQGRQWINPRNRADRPVGGEGMERAPSGGRGMDQQAPTAGRRNGDFEYITRASGEPFQAHGAAKASKVFREAKKAGRNPTVAKVDGGFAVRVPADPKRYQMRPIDQAAHQAATSPSNDLPAPTPAQIEAGNYKKGRIRVQGLDISIENPRGSERSGTGPDGTPWRRTMSDHYGYIKRTTGADGEQVDVYAGPQPDSAQVFVVDQVNQQDGSFDEHKVMLGYPDQESAVTAYRSNFDKGWQVGPVTAMPVDRFKAWLKTGDLSAPLAQPEAPATRPEPPTTSGRKPPRGQRRSVNRDRDSVVQAAIRLGGITTQWKQDTTGDTKGNKNIPGVGALWSDKTGTSIDDMASLLDQNGYVPAGEMDNLGGVPWLQAALRDELSGRKTHVAPGSKLEEAQAAKAEADYLEAQIAAAAESGDLDAELDAKLDMAWDMGDDAAEMERRRLAAEAFAAELDEIFGDTPNEQKPEPAIGSTDRAPQGADSPADGNSGSAGEGEPGAVRGTDARAESESEVTPALELQSQTEEELAAADAANKARIKAEEKAQAEAEQKALADRDRNDFTLTGSDRPSDVAAARGQNDMFAPQTRGEKKAAERASAPAVEPDGFIKAPDGSLDFGEITPEMAQAAGRQAGKIRLQQGNESWGLQHVELRHGAEIRDAGFADVPAFVADIAQHIDQVWKPAATRQLVALHAAGKNRVMFVELQPGRDESGDFYTVKTAFPARPGYTKKENWKLLWEARAQASGESGNRPSFAVSPPVAGGEVTIPSSQSSEASIAPHAGGKPAADQAGGRPAESKIEDAGEKLGGARKDQLRTVRDRLDDMGDEEIAGSSLSQLWPKGELDKISDPFEAALYHVVRGLIPAKPRVSYRVKAWVGKVKAARDILTTLGGIGANATAEKMRAYSPGLGIIADQIEVLMALDRKHWGRIDNIRRAHGRYNQDGEMVPGSWVSLNIDGRQVSFYGHESVASAIPAIKDRVEGKDAPEKRMKFAIYTDRQTSDVFVVKEGDAEMRRLKTFKTVKEARAFLNDEYEAAVALWDAVKNRDNVTKSDMRRSTNDPRVGQNHRDGKDVTPAQFLKAFGFRGVEFGNWVKQGAGGRDRQGMLNDAYDAFMDLASILNIPPKALSLEGKLGIGFGSRGSGKASAHFEPGNIVINLTKTKGAGSLAHEWFHAIDNYFARKRERPVESVGKAPDRQEAYITYRPEPLLVNKKHPTMRMTRAELSRYQANHPNAPLYAEGNWEPDSNHPKGVRPQVEKAFAELVATLNASPMLQRAKVIDGKTSDGYWSRIIERGARSFETYVIARLADRGFRNDYLANVQTLEQFARDPGRYPYLTPDEQGPVNEAFDKLFATLETKETDQGVSLFSRASGPIDPAGLSESSVVTGKVPENPISLEQAIAAAEQFLSDYNGNIELNYRIRKKQDELYGPGSIAKIGVVKGAYHPGRGLFTLASDHLSSAADAYETLRHEILGHYGLDTFSPQDKQALLDKIIASKEEPSLKLIWDDIAVLYADKSQNIQAEEVFARLAESPRSGKEKLADLIGSLLTRLLRKVLGYKKGVITRRELLREIEVISKGIRNGSRQRQTFESETKQRRGAQTETPAFKRWFGDSKVVDADGKPLVVYHGTTSDFESFDREKVKTGVLGHGFYFASRPESTRTYSGGSRFGGAGYADGGNVMPVYLSIKNPMILKRGDKADIGAEAKGHDGVIQLDAEGNIHTLVAFRPEQIKSAVGNNGDFDPANPDIRYRLSDTDAKGIPLFSARAIAKKVMAATGLNATVVNTEADLPADLQAQIKRDKATGRVAGVYHNGTAYLVASNLRDAKHAVSVMLHEEVGHRGIHGLLGDKLDATMERLYTSQAASAKGRQRIAQIREAYAKVLRKLDARKQRLMIAEEMVALLIEDGERPTALQRVLSKIRELLRALIPQVPWTYTDILALGEQSRRWLRDNQAGTTDGERTLYALGGKRQHTSEAFSDLTAKQKEALNKIAPRTAKQQAIEWFRQQSDRALLKIRQGIVDRYAALRDLDEAVHGKDVLSTDIASSAWVLARMSSAASGALHAMLNNGRIYLDQQQKVIDIQDGEALGLGATLARLGSAAEIERFMGWIAGNRSAKLAAEGRENLFDAAEIDALRTLNRGTTEHGKARGALYNEVFAEFQQYRDDVLAIAEQTGVITPESRALWRDEFYVPFYRVMDDDAAAGPMASKGLTRQEAYKKLKGGNQHLNDLLQNTLLNFNHLLQASLKNQAAAQAIDNAEQLGIAQPVSEAARDKKASTFVLKAGVKQWYNIGDPLVFEALSSLSDAGLNNAAVRAMSFFKRLFTNMTTITPQFIIANLLRDSMSATATSSVSKNFLKNIAVGGKDWTDARKRARMLASGGAFSFGHIYSNDPDEVKAHLKRNLRSAKLIDGPKLVPQALKAGWDTWNSVANTAENANRAAIFEQNEQGRGKLAAAFEARDLMDFSIHGAWPAVRFLIRVVPFLNARLQGLDKLYRAGVKPSLLTAFGQGSASDKQAAARFMTVVAALSLASMALLLVNNDDEEYRKLEEWEKDTYWNFFIGGMHWRIPKPFEVGAIATMAERLLQQAIDDKATGKLFAQRLWHTLTQTFSFSPVPHMFQPVLDVYSNVDAFTGRPIESTGMDRLSKGLRTRATTTAPARAASAVSRVFGDEFPLAVSPIQADHLIAGYLGQVGAWGAGMVDTMWRAANGESQPAKHWHEYQPIRRFYRDLDTPAAYTRYSTIFYEGLREAGKAYADVKELQELGRMDEAREVIREKRDVLGVRKQLNQVQRRLTAINSRMDAVRLGELDADAKRRELDRLLVIKNRLTEMAGKRLEDMRAKR